MIILIGGESHTGKTFLAQRLLERYSFPYFSLDHLKMGLIRGLADCGFTAESPDALISEKMWRIVEGIGWWAVGGTLLGLISSTMSAYIVAKYKFFGRGFFYGLAIVTMMLPIVGAMPSQYTVYDSLGILDSPGMLLTCANGFGFNFIVLYGFFKSLPWDFVEASFLDGAGHLQTMLYIMLPQAMPVIGSLGIVA